MSVAVSGNTSPQRLEQLKRDSKKQFSNGWPLVYPYSSDRHWGMPVTCDGPLTLRGPCA